MTKKKETKKHRGWCFTINNYTDDDMASCMSLFQDNIGVTYMIAGFERADRTGTPHIQGYLYFKNQVRFDTVKNMFHNAHIEMQKCKFNVAAYCYCMEDGDFYEMGSRPRQGHRTDLEVIKHDMMNGKSMKDISLQYFSQWCQYRRAFDDYRKLHGLETGYDTELIQYDEHAPQSYEDMYLEYDYKTDLVVSEIMHPPQIMNLYKSGKYKRIYLPSFNVPNWMEEKYIKHIW